MTTVKPGTGGTVLDAGYTAAPMSSDLRAAALEAVRRCAEAQLAPEPFEPGRSTVPVAAKVVDAADLVALTEAVLDGWLTEGRFARAFTEAFATTAGRRHAVLVGSGSQANLLAVAAACSHLHEQPLRPGDEVLTAAIGFPTTVAPVYQHGLVPVYVDVEPDTYNPSLEALEAAIGPRTRAVVLAHTLGNPFDAPALAALCRERGLVLIEDVCDALGSTIAGRAVGTFGHAATYSFYPAHHMTTGEGGAVTCDDEAWRRALASLREWGRDCWCPPGVNDACGRRLEGRFGELPAGYDHKYVFSHVGFNFKVTDMQAALGLAQLERLEGFHAARRRNFRRLDDALADLDERLVRPRTIAGADPSWFGYPFTLREGGAAERRELQRFLIERRIDSRLVLGGNLTRQPGYLGLDHRVVGPLTGADRVTEASVWVGCHPGLTGEMVDWIAESVRDFLLR
jgi:CDP-4-dehydro-6-deoxyglucose reductase, E1